MAIDREQFQLEEEQRFRLERAFKTRDYDQIEEALNNEEKIYPYVVIHLMVNAHKLGIDDIAKQKSAQSGKAVMQRHAASLKIPGIGHFKSTEEKQKDAARRARELWASQKDQGKLKKWVYATIAESFGVTAGAVKNWVSNHGGIE